MANQCPYSYGNKSKTCYPTKAQAEKARKHSHVGGLSVYFHRACGSWHLTSAEQYGKPEPIPSAAKLRRKLEEARRQIAASEKRLTTAEKNYLEELRYVHRQMDRIVWMPRSSK